MFPPQPLHSSPLMSSIKLENLPDMEMFVLPKDLSRSLEFSTENLDSSRLSMLGVWDFWGSIRASVLGRVTLVKS